MELESPRGLRQLYQKPSSIPSVESKAAPGQASEFFDPSHEKLAGGQDGNSEVDRDKLIYLGALDGLAFHRLDARRQACYLHCTVVSRFALTGYIRQIHMFKKDRITYTNCLILLSVSVFIKRLFYWAPKVCNAAFSSRTAVSASSKFNAEIAQRACFCAFAIAASSVFNFWFRAGCCTAGAVDVVDGGTKCCTGGWARAGPGGAGYMGCWGCRPDGGVGGAWR